MTLHKQLVNAEILQQKPFVEGVFQLTLDVPEITSVAEAGQFVQLQVGDEIHVLRRPLGIASMDKAKGRLVVIYRVIGRGTAILSSRKKGEMVNVLGPLGHGFSMEFERPLLVGGGMGLSPLLSYAEVLNGKASILMGGKNAKELFWEELFRQHCTEVCVTSDDGSRGQKGFTTDFLPQLLDAGNYDGVVVCGPEIMMRKVAGIAKAREIPCQVSLEKRMACGLGACLSCSVDTRAGRKKVCKDGPVFWAQEVF